MIANFLINGFETLFGKIEIFYTFFLFAPFSTGEKNWVIFIQFQIF